MADNNISPICKEVIDSINSKIENIKEIISSKDEEIDKLKKDLKLSESGRQTAESMVTQIKESASEEIKKAYNSGYNAALTTANPAGGTTIENNDNKTLVLSNN